MLTVRYISTSQVYTCAFYVYICDHDDSPTSLVTYVRELRLKLRGGGPPELWRDTDESGIDSFVAICKREKTAESEKWNKGVVNER